MPGPSNIERLGKFKMSLNRELEYTSSSMALVVLYNQERGCISSRRQKVWHRYTELLLSQSGNYTLTEAMPKPALVSRATVQNTVVEHH